MLKVDSNSWNYLTINLMNYSHKLLDAFISKINIHFMTCTELGNPSCYNIINLLNVYTFIIYYYVYILYKYKTNYYQS